MAKKKAGEKKAGKHHPSLSDVQDEAEAVALEILRERDGYKTLAPREVPIGSAVCKPDGVNDGAGRIVEIYARVGRLKGAQTKKVATDVLKFAAIQKQPGFENAKCEIYFVDADARSSVTGWIKEAAREFDVHLGLLRDFPDDLKEKLLEAQERQATGTKKKPPRQDKS